ncbi:MAG: MFS transporter [Sporolactobacillus sp.]|uniref:MFS transporter n=1 Tax=Sporolactobacillus sp. STSJ-5 TaxID=2965076 RepID=UPI0021020AC2|nr:MFS transporter [Sporolactobacillus sp. STSJ-5]MCQ2010903.1 MFS transporter [Sporolactobacillus sp. STSJ-5]
MNTMTKSNKLRLSISLYLNYFVHGIGLLILTQNMRPLSSEWGTSIATVSYVISGVGVGRLLAYYFLGSLSDRYGRKKIILFGMISYSIFFIGILLTKDFKVAYLLAILAGVANSALDSGTYPTFLEMNRNNGAASILIKAAMSIGEFVLPLYIGLNENLGGWYGLSFIFAAALLLINAVLISQSQFPLQAKPEKTEQHHLFSNGKLSKAKIGLVTILSLYGYTSMALMILFTQWITLYGIDVLHMSNMQAHFLLSLYSIGSIVGVLLVFTILKSALIKEGTLMVIMNGLSLLFLLTVSFSLNHLAVTVASFFFGVTAAGGIMQVGLTIFSSMFPHAKGRVTAIFFSFGSIASFTVPIFTGMLSNIGTAYALRSDLVIASFSLVLWIIGHRLLTLSSDCTGYETERSQINFIDYWILKLLQWRFKLAKSIGMKKMNQGLQVLDPFREKEIISRIDQRVKDHENRDHYQEIFQTILTNSKQCQTDLQEKGRVK